MAGDIADLGRYILRTNRNIHLFLTKELKIRKVSSKKRQFLYPFKANKGQEEVEKYYKLKGY